MKIMVRTMGKISQMKRKMNYHKIFEQIFEDPKESIYGISQKANLSRNTVSKYLRRMYAQEILIGPQIRMKPAPNYKEYVYLMNFKNPFQVFEGLKEFPHVLYHTMTFGDWNTMVVTDQLLDLSQLVGFQDMVRQGVRGRSYTPKVMFTEWEKGFSNAYDQINRFIPSTEYKERAIAPRLDWGEDEWKLFHAFKFNMRKKVTPTLRKIKVRYETYTKWIEDLETHCTIHVGFYPEGYQAYMTYCFLFSSDHERAVRSLFSHFPTTPFIVEMGNQLMVFANLRSSDLNRKMFCLIYDTDLKRMIKGYNQAVAVFHCHHNPEQKY
jgi:hypothetical protein